LAAQPGRLALAGESPFLRGGVPTGVPGWGVEGVEAASDPAVDAASVDAASSGRPASRLARAAATTDA
jgi:hypothetical protein